MASSPTQPSTPRLSEVARHVVFPKGIDSTAWPRVVAKCAELGVEFDAWQHGIGSIALGKRKDGKYAATVGGVVLSIPRQVGKTFLVGMIVISLCLLFPGMTWLWTAHHNRTTTKTFLTLKGLTERAKIKPHMLDPRMSNGEQEIRFRNGSRIMFGAREQGFGRGFDEVDGEVFDEAQILAARALEDMVPATNQSKHEAGPLLFLMGTPPRPTDPGEEFTNRRRVALSGEAEDMVYVEFSADDDADPNDRKQWAKANPSYPSRTPVESMKRMRANLTDDASFMREGLGVWDDLTTGAVISAAAWARHLEPAAKPAALPVFALDVSPYRDMASIAVAVQSDLKVPLVMLTQTDQGVDTRPGTAWVVDRMLGLAERWKVYKVHLTGKAAESLRADLERVGLEVVALTLPELAHGCGLLYDAAVSPARKGLAHHGQAELSQALALAVRRDTDDGWSWGRRKSAGDITPLVAITCAFWAYTATTQRQTFVSMR